MQTAEKISITMTPEMLRIIRDTVTAGEYASTSDVARDAMRVWQRERQEHAERLNAIRARVRRSFDDPRTNLSEQDADTELEAAFDKIDEDLDRAARNG
ncbi:ribbon-helix-helix domain-containing protein [Agrobacterium rosae]|uniref:Type II toxin-antitoxin system ParD family antitoxin n=1 Tax=Agrobacterium rosae TaxID=1972867 RepID=A0AAW9FTN5_9HYPH|nr:type II toxin-antitoxin system ParD family antitoxin [Agrobacterium rosae]MDX8305904.1 type II toxin-antitoxin system ParD family antitoxin [Agrobacterium rosae]